MVKIHGLFLFNTIWYNKISLNLRFFHSDCIMRRVLAKNVNQSFGHKFLCIPFKMVAVGLERELWIQESLELEWVALGA